ncbi:MAG: hypothetical protein MJ106_01430 [Lentisphaeria bacterium]|nr:hypothetical protein [Lentisphaeria bacterium]
MKNIIGIGGAGSKIATKLSEESIVVNVSEVELSKVVAKEKIQAILRGGSGAYKGCRMDPVIGHEAYASVSRELEGRIRGSLVIAATGGGTGNGITKGIMDYLVKLPEKIRVEDKTLFALVLPYARLESAEFVENTSMFLNESVAPAIDSGNTGNIFMFTNRLKFEERIPEDHFNQMIVGSLKEFLAIPQKNAELKLLDGHIDQEDFDLFLSKPYFNHFTVFNYDAGQEFGRQLSEHTNTLLLPAEAPIEALFLMEVPVGGDQTSFYNLVEYFNRQGVKPIYSVAENPEIGAPRVTVSQLYSRKPAELVHDFNTVADQHAQTKVKKTITQYVQLEPLEVNMADEAKKVKTSDQDDIVALLKRIHKI